MVSFRFRLPAWRTLAALLLMAGCLMAQSANSDSLPGVDFSGLTAAQKTTVMKLLKQQDCSCHCGMKIAECRVNDPGCAYSTGLAAAMIEAIKKGGSESDAIQAAAKSKWAQGPPAQSTQLLDAPVAIPVTGSPVTGPASAPITLVEFSDFQCPYCVAATPELHALLKAYPTQVKLIFKQYPLEIHSRAAFAAAAALAAQHQGKFWPMHDALFANHNDLSRENVLAIAQKLGLNTERFTADLESPQTVQAIQKDVADGDQVGVQGTPTIFINGQKFNGPIQLDVLKPVLDSELKQNGPEKTASASAQHP
jgi:protein-disulfide isomerase